MNRWFRSTPLLLLALLFFAAPAARAQAAKPEAKQPPHARVVLYRIAPGKQLDFLKWLAEAEAIDKEAGVPSAQLYSHSQGDSWDYMQVAPDLSNEQQAKVDEITRKHGRKTGFAASLEFRTFAAWHTDTLVIGPPHHEPDSRRLTACRLSGARLRVRRSLVSRGPLGFMAQLDAFHFKTTAST